MTAGYLSLSPVSSGCFALSPVAAECWSITIPMAGHLLCGAITISVAVGGVLSMASRLDADIDIAATLSGLLGLSVSVGGDVSSNARLSGQPRITECD